MFEDESRHVLRRKETEKERDEGKGQLEKWTTRRRELERERDGTNREMFPHLLRDRTQPDRREVVDREPRVLGVVEREHVLERSLHAGLSKPLRQLLHSQLLRHLLEQNLDEDTTGRGGLVLVHVDDVEDSP